jgi:hypothetical protein
MTAPIEIAYATLAGEIAGRLVGAGVVTRAEALEVDPMAPTEIDGEETDLTSAAILLKLSTAPVRTLIGKGVPTYVVERQARLELAVAGPDRDVIDRLLADGLAALAPIGTLDPTLGGAAERCGLNGSEDADFPPNGRKVFLGFFVRVRSGDPLGLTPPAA